MRKLMSLKFLVVISMASLLLLTAPQVRAQDDDFGIDGMGDSSGSENAISSKADESEIIDSICKRMCTKDEKFGKATLELKK